MASDDPTAKLDHIPVESIVRNPDNPRINFRQQELDELTESIRRHGVQVPIAVYKSGKQYVLIDGERRWRCSLKLNRHTIPALIQPKPDPLNNLLLMFNIHALREQWDLLTVAMKLPKIIELIKEQHGSRQPKEREICEATGLSRAIYRRSRLLLDMPEKYREELLAEIHKPKSQQQLTEDLYIEMERALKTVQNSMPEVIKNIDAARRVIIDKYKTKTIKNIVDLRNIAKIARAENIKSDKKKAEGALQLLFQKNNYSAIDAFKDTVASAYEERDLSTRIDGLLDRLPLYDTSEIDDSIRSKLKILIRQAKRLLEDEE